MTDAKVDAMTVGELRQQLNPDRNVVIMLDSERGFGVIMATGAPLTSLMSILVGNADKTEFSQGPFKPPVKA